MYLFRYTKIDLADIQLWGSRLVDHPPLPPLHEINENHPQMMTSDYSYCFIHFASQKLTLWIHNSQLTFYKAPTPKHKNIQELLTSEKVRNLLFSVDSRKEKTVAFVMYLYKE